MKTNFGLKEGMYCVLKDQPSYGIAKIMKFVNVNGRKCAECEWTMGIHDAFGFVKTFKLIDLKKWKSATL